MLAAEAANLLWRELACLHVLLGSELSLARSIFIMLSLISGESFNSSDSMAAAVVFAYTFQNLLFW